MASSAAIEQRNQDATCYCGGLDEKVTEELLWELMTNAGPVVHVHIPRDKVTGNHQAFGFVEFRTEEDAEYACKVREGKGKERREGGTRRLDDALCCSAGRGRMCDRND